MKQLLCLAFALLLQTIDLRGEQTILNASYDPTRELYLDYNHAFASLWKRTKGEDVVVEQSHGGSGSQARAVIDGLPADVVTLALAYDIDAIATKTRKLPKNWQKRLPNNSCPYNSAIVFLVRKGNPKGIKDWDDLVKGSVSVITPNPKTSGGARWNYLAAWAYAKKKYGSDEEARKFITTLYQHVPLLDNGARAATTTFIVRGLGDVLLTWENEAFLAIDEVGADKVEIVMPSITILTEPPVALIDKNAKRNGTFDVATNYLQYLYSPEGQRIIAKHYYRPFKPEYADKADLRRFSKGEFVTVDQAFGGWQKIHPIHFGEGGVFDQIYQPS